MKPKYYISLLIIIAAAAIAFYYVNRPQSLYDIGGITTILSTDTLKDSRLVINSNFAYLENNKLDNADMSGGEGITYAATGTISFDCSEVEGTGIDCSGEDITLDATGDWTGTLDGYEASALVGGGSTDYLGSIGDVSTTTLAAGYVLKYSGSEWESVATSTLGLGGSGSMTYPDAGIALSTGSAWDTSIADNSADWDTAYGWGDWGTQGFETQAQASSSFPTFTYASSTFATSSHAHASYLTSGTIDTISELNAILTGEDVASTSGTYVNITAGTATALAADPTDCTAGQYATAINASGNLTCSATSTFGYMNALSDNTWTLHNNYPTACTGGQVMSGIGDTLACVATSTNANTASALLANPSDCGAGAAATAIDASGNLTCSITPLVSGGTLTSGKYCTYDGTGIDCDSEGGAAATTSWEFATSTATAAQTVFVPGFTYDTGENQLEVYVNGLRMTIKDDYTETSSTTITFVSGREEGDKVTFQVSGGATAGSGSGDGSVTSVDMSVPTGLTVAGNPITDTGTLAVTLTAGYIIPLSASTTAWNNFLNTPSGVITAGNGIDWTANTLNVLGVDEAYASGWNADTGVPEKDDIYDWGHVLDTDDDGLVNGMDTDGIDTITEIAAALKDGSGDCASGLLCLGDHTHSGYLAATSIDTIAEFNAILTGEDVASTSGTYANITAGKATALAADPTDCGANTWATTIADSGNLTCGAVTYAGITAMTSANFAGLVNNETGTGLVVLQTSPTLVSPILGQASSTDLTVSGNSYIGTIKSGTWNGTAIGVGYGGTGLTSATAGYFLIGGSATVLQATSTIFITTTGSVGIGSTSPMAKFVVNSGTTATTTVQIGDSTLGVNPGKFCFWNGTNYTVEYYPLNSVTKTIATSTTCN